MPAWRCSFSYTALAAVKATCCRGRIPSSLGPRLIFYLITLFFAAAGEEMIFHGYAFQCLVEKIGPYAAVIPVGVIFGLLHGDNPHATRSRCEHSFVGHSAGLRFSAEPRFVAAYWHSFRLESVLPLFGVNLSGITMEVTRYFYKWDLPVLWSGGAYGPEGGLFTTVFGGLDSICFSERPLRPQIAAIATTLNEPDDPLTFACIL